VRRALPLLFSLLAVASACGGNVERQAARDAPLTPADLGWLERYGNWSTRYEHAGRAAGQTNVDLLGGASSVAELERSLRPIKACAKRFDKSVVREAPTRFAPVEPLVGRMCEQLRLAAERLVKSFSDPATHAYATEEHFSNAATLLLEVDAEIQRRMAANRPLPSLRGGTASRSDPRLGRIASRLASRSVDTRCWSKRDWPAILRESRAYGNRNVDFVGLADPHRGRIHLAPTICQGLALLLDRRESRARLTAGDDLAEAVETFAHEIEHILAPGTERRVECTAVQRTAEIAVALGTSRRFGRRLADVYWRRIYPEMPDSYWSEHCKSGGAFDVNPGSSGWPTP
jgi:hypothetical protein